MQFLAQVFIYSTVGCTAVSLIFRIIRIGIYLSSPICKYRHASFPFLGTSCPQTGQNNGRVFRVKRVPHRERVSRPMTLSAPPFFWTLRTQTPDGLPAIKACFSLLGAAQRKTVSILPPTCRWPQTHNSSSSLVLWWHASGSGVNLPGENTISWQQSNLSPYSVSE